MFAAIRIEITFSTQIGIDFQPARHKFVSFAGVFVRSSRVSAAMR